MKKLLGIFSLISLLGCATIGGGLAQSATAAELICADAREYVANGSAAANVEMPDKIFEAEVESCGQVPEDGLGYAVYHINVYEKNTGKFKAHMKRMIVYAKRGNVWTALEDGAFAILPPIEPKKPAPPQSQLKI